MPEPGRSVSATAAKIYRRAALASCRLRCNALSIPVTGRRFRLPVLEILLPCHSNADRVLRRDEVIYALSIRGNGELHALDDSVELVPPRSIVR